MVPRESSERVNVALRIGDASVPLEMDVPARPVKLRRMLPVIRQMSNSFISSGVEQLTAAGSEISCRAGCGACCRQIVPVSEAEAFDLRGLLDEMPEERRSAVAERFSEGMERLNSAGYFERLAEAASASDDRYDEAVREYFRFGIPCPFLEDESCSIHDSRPITCREYLVTSPPEYCASAEGEGVANVRHFFQVKEALISLSQDKTRPELPYIPMIAVMDWTDKHSDDSRELTGREWAREFFDNLARFSRPPGD